MKLFKSSILVIVFLAVTNFSCAQQKQYQLSTHILDVSEGLPVANVSIKLEKMNTETKKWEFIGQKETSEKGRINDFLPLENENNGVYRFTFLTADYFKKNGKESFYPFIEVVFDIKENTHYHVPITLSAYGYSTYRGN
ncbi:hydroxyisourate hydrolase [Bizionia gelidisalsuginis]|uniref:5-hydroxyisourate hydrolase n=1 Tax=Bizionia gelidisalsuginis TaxID=291188 RepID=A0ABY3MBD0_9FLAO|nr:hydroxyisourate hydrolase [Bizionia gelidisalsuginis]TYC14117.1 hydroxyisourate hydrolase [Bizionia gelidisalsuginis]